MRRTLLVVDGNSLLHRAFHAYAGTGFRVGGEPAWAVRGLLTQLAAAVDRSCAEAVVVGFDDPERSLRRERWPVYKAQRPDKLPGFVDQLRLAVRTLIRLGSAVCVPAGLEADDVLASAAAQAPGHGWQSVLVTSDRDAFALVDEHTRVLRILNGGVDASPMLTPQRLPLVTGVAAHQYRDLAALRGDPSDNLPGVRGVGPRKAGALLAEFDCAEAMFDDAAAGGQRCREVVGVRLAARLGTAEARDAWEFNRAVMATHTDLNLEMELPSPRPGAGALPLDGSAVAEVFAEFDLFLPSGLRALAGVEPRTRPPREADVDPAWRPWRPRVGTRLPALPKPMAPKVVQDALF